MLLNRGAWSTEYIPGVTKKMVDLNPQVGGTQRMSFATDATRFPYRTQRQGGVRRQGEGSETGASGA